MTQHFGDDPLVTLTVVPYDGTPLSITTDDPNEAAQWLLRMMCQRGYEFAKVNDDGSTGRWFVTVERTFTEPPTKQDAY